jgi:hypothetical protein
MRLAVFSFLPLFLAPLYLRADEPVATANAPAASTPAIKQAAMADGFLRFVDHGIAGGRLETADVTYRNADGVTVRLVSAVHIGETSYYNALNKSFVGDDAVLYELVKPRDAPAPGLGEKLQSGSGVGEIQRFLKDALKLDFQLDAVDYSCPNFVHADLDAETFRRLQEERGETFEMLLFKQVMKAMSPEARQEQAQAIEQDPEQMLREMIRLVTLPDTERRLKLMIAKQMTSVELEAAGFGGENSVIVAERNKAAMDVLAETIQKGKRKISVFYGAAHMPDFAKRLEGLGFKPVDTQWRLAWDLAIRQEQPSMIEDLLIEGLKALSEGE